jgi:hypothetical protein
MICTQEMLVTDWEEPPLVTSVASQLSEPVIS